MAENAIAGEVCVTCAAPSATYRCTVEGDPTTAAVGPAAQLLCIKQMAALHQHQSCSVERGGKGTCTGELVTVARPLNDPAQATDFPTTSAAAPADAAPSAIPVNPGPKPPETMEQLANQAAAQSKKDLAVTSNKVKEGTQAVGREVEKAGSNLGTAAKKSWECLVSLFSRC